MTRDERILLIRKILITAAVSVVVVHFVLGMLGYAARKAVRQHDQQQAAATAKRPAVAT